MVRTLLTAMTTASLSADGCPKYPRASTLAKSALRLSYAPMAGKPCLPAMSPTSMEPGPSHTDISMENNWGEGSRRKKH